MCIFETFLQNTWNTIVKKYAEKGWGLLDPFLMIEHKKSIGLTMFDRDFMQWSQRPGKNDHLLVLYRIVL